MRLVRVLRSVPRKIGAAVLGLALAALCGTATGWAQTAVPAEIVELSRALKGDPDLIFEYVYNNIDTLPQYGSLKGAYGALLDRKGTAFDQAELMAALLQQAGVTASFQTGSIQLTAAQLSNWLGIDGSSNSISFAIGSGGFPATILTDGNNNATGVQLGWAWVVVNIGGTNYVFDPATKIYQRSAGTANLLSTIGYAPSSFLSDAESSATITSTSISGISRANIRRDLATYAGNLVSFIRANSPTATPLDIIGGKTIVPLPLNTQQRQTSLSYAVSGTVESDPTLGDEFRTTISFELGYLDTSNNFVNLVNGQQSSSGGGSVQQNGVSFNSSDIYGHRIVLSFNSSLAPTISVDGVADFAPGVAPPANMALVVQTTVSHPYPPGQSQDTIADTHIQVTPVPGGLYLIAAGFGVVDRGMIEKHRRLLQQNTTQNSGNATAEPVLGEALAVLGYTWLAERSQFDQMLGELTGNVVQYHHAVGIVGIRPVGNSSGPYVDLPINVLSFTQRVAHPSTSPTPSETAAFIGSGFFSSAAETGTLEQTQPGLTAASTVKLIDSWIQSGSGQIFDIDNNAVSGDTASFYTTSIRPTLAQTYAPADLSRIDSLVNSSGLRVIAPANGSIVINQYTGTGYFVVAQNGEAFGAIISGGLSGGFAADPELPPVLDDDTSSAVGPAPTDINAAPLQTQGNAGGTVGQTPTSNEPINLVTGDYLVNATDLTVGNPRASDGLAFSRYYDSGNRAINGPLGLGWTHSFAMTALPDSNPFEGIGARSPINAAIGITAALVLQDMLTTNSGATPLDRFVISAVIGRWVMDQLTANVINVAMPGYVEQFVKLADGSYNPPFGTASTLTLASGAFTYVTKHGVTLSFNTTGSLETLATPAGATLTLAYNTASPPQLTEVSNSSGRAFTFSYNSSNQLASVADGTGRSVSYAYDSSGNLTKYTDASGNATTYAYGAPGQLTQIFYPALPSTAVVTNTYDSLGRVMTQANADNSSAFNTTWQYFFAGSRSEEDDPAGTQHVLYSNPRGKTLTEIRDLQGLSLVTTYAYDGLDRVTGTTLPAGNSRSYTYDTSNNLLSVTATPPSGSTLSPLTTTFTYNSTFNKPASAVDPLGRTATFTYDAAKGNLLSRTADSGGAPHLNATTSFTYDSLGHVLTRTDPLGIVTQFAYDGAGDLTSLTRDAGSGHLNQVTSFAYDAVGDVTSATDPLGHVTTSAYDVMRRKTQVTLPAPSSLVASFSYDANGRLLQTQRAAGGAVLQTASATYTPSGQRATVTDANGNTTTYVYDPLERLQQVRDPLGRTTDFAYDALSRLAQVLNAGISSQPLEQRAYTPNSRLASFADANGHVTAYAYDGFDRLAQTIYPDGSFAAYTYDADGNVLTRRTRAGETIAYTYDTLNRLIAKAPPPPGFAVSYSYDLDGRLTGIGDNSPAIAAVAVPGGGASIAYTTSFSYDGNNRLSAVDWDTVLTPAVPTASAVTFGYAYNADNQRIQQTATDNGWWLYPAATPSPTGYTANALNQYTAIGSVSPTYDARGNLTFDGTFTYGYDAESRLVSATGAGNSASYTYDAKGRRKSKTVNGTTTNFVWAGGREILEYDGSSGQLLQRYVYGKGGQGLSLVDGAGNRSTPVPDIQGSRIALIDGVSGSVTKTGYLPFGESADATGAFRYTGQRIDAETNGLYYYRARMYSPALGRFLQPDPAGYAGGRNLYAYVGNDPLNLIDPTGLAALDNSQGMSWRGWLAQTSAPEAAEAEAIADAYKENPQFTMIAGSIGLCSALCLPAILAGGELLAGAGAVEEIGAAGGAADAAGTGVADTAAGGAADTAATGTANTGATGAAEEVADTSKSLVTVMHFTDQAGVDAITGGSSTLRAGTFVTLPSEVEGLSASEVDSALEIAPGRGAFSTTFQTPASNLATPFNGPLTSGGAVQYQLINPAAVGPFVPTLP